MPQSKKDKDAAAARKKAIAEFDPNEEFIVESVFLDLGPDTSSGRKEMGKAIDRATDPIPPSQRNTAAGKAQRRGTGPDTSGTPGHGGDSAVGDDTPRGEKGGRGKEAPKPATEPFNRAERKVIRKGLRREARRKRKNR